MGKTKKLLEIANGKIQQLEERKKVIGEIIKLNGQPEIYKSELCDIEDSLAALRAEKENYLALIRELEEEKGALRPRY